MNFVRSVVLGLALAPLVSLASSINVTPLSLPFVKANQRYQDLTVYNTGKDTAYVNVVLKKVLNPGNRDLKFEAFNHNPASFGLVATPNKLIIPKGQTRVVRVMRLLHGNKKEAVYQINIAPAEGVLERIKTGKHNVDAGVRVIVGYNVIARVLPNNPGVSISTKRQGDRLIITNTGNSSALLYRGKQCVGKACSALPTKRMYAGLRWETSIKPSAKAQYTERFLGENRKVTV